MADFVLSRHNAFTFALDDSQKETYTIPFLNGLSFEDAKLITGIDDTKDLVERGNMIKEFILSHCPGLEEKGLGDMEFFEIYNAYGLALGKDRLGESKASRNS